MNKKVIYSTLASSLICASASLAGEINPEVTKPSPVLPKAGFETTLTTGYHSKYIWRGLDFGNDMVDLSLETTGKFIGLDLTAGAWQSRVFDQSPGVNKNELNLYTEAAKDLGFAKASVGYIFYDFSDSGVGTRKAHEVYFGLSKEIAGITTSLTYYWDIQVDNQGYTELELQKSFTGPFTKHSLDASVVLGYLVEEGALSHLTGTLSKSFDIGHGLTVSPYVSYVVELDDLERYAGNSQKNEFIGGISLSYSF